MARRFYHGSNVERAQSIEELRHMARCRLPGFAFEYLDGGAEDEVALRRNREIFDTIAFVPRTLVKVGSMDMTVRLFGRTSLLPITVAPTGFNGLFADHGDLALARAAATADVPFIQSTMSNSTIEEVAAVPGLRHWMQIYVFRSRIFAEQLIERALTAGCEALVVTSDGPVFGNREWDRRNYRTGTDPTFWNKLEILRHPRWMRNVLLRGIPAFANLAQNVPSAERSRAATIAWLRSEMDPDLDWTSFSEIRKLWPRKLILKGVLDVEDAQRAFDEGADGLVLSNHGGRQLDGAISPMSALPAIAAKVGCQVPIMIDSGFRRGSDVVKALALGADSVLLGRSLLYGLAVGGEKGVTRALAIVSDEIQRTLALLGRSTLSVLDPACLQRSF